jgi:hypothetical protein
MPFSFGNAFNRFFSLLGANFVSFATIGLICTILPAMAAAYGEFTYLGINLGDPTWIQKVPGFTPNIWAFTGIAWLVYMLFYLVSRSAVTEIAILRSVGKPVNYGAAIGNGLKNAIPLLVVEILVGLLVGLGFILLFVPGIIWSLCVCVALPAYVGETKLGIFGAIGKSFQLTRNHRWSLFLLFIVMGVISAVAAGIMGTTTIGLPGGMTGLPSLLTRGFINGIFALLGQILSASIYVGLRESKEKIAPDVAASVF